MILGVWNRHKRNGGLACHLLQAAARVAGGAASDQAKTWENGHVAFCWMPSMIATLDEPFQPFHNASRSVASFFEGKLYNAAELNGALKSDVGQGPARSGATLPDLYERHGDRFLDRVNGKFACAVWDETKQRLLLARDRLGIEPLFYYQEPHRLVFSSSLRALLATGWLTEELNHDAVLQYLLYCYNPSAETFLRGVRKLPAGHLLSIDRSGSSVKPYWRLDFAEKEEKREEEYRSELLGLIDSAVRLCLDRDRLPGVLLSGGTDSSTIVSLTSKAARQPVKTFSFRCAGRSYDESQYARLVARRFGTEHTEIPYEPDHLRKISNAVRFMDEPFCDIGIEIATYLLGEAAQGKVSYVFSGEGGDELFGGHPVYVADKFGAAFDYFPRFITRPLRQLLQRIPDTDQKKNFQVKVKRFAYSLSFPPEMLSHRWRAYYTPDELAELCSREFLASCDLGRVYEPILQYSGGTNAWDPLSRSLYSDYYTLVDFYLRRLSLLRSFAIEGRQPLLDYRLIEYAARIPSRMKIKGFSDTKYIYRKILKDVVPREILYDRPKLGHSVPMKNWLRDDVKLQNWVEEILSDPSTLKRRLFDPVVMRRLLQEHRARRHNHSHRLWALVVFELWMRSWFNPRTFNAADARRPAPATEGLRVQ